MGSLGGLNGLSGLSGLIESGVNYLFSATWYWALDQGYANGQSLDTEGEGMDVGEMTVVEVDGEASVLANQLRLTGQATPVHGDLGLYSPDPTTKSFGLAFIGRVYRDVSNATRGPVFGLSPAADVRNPSQMTFSIYLNQNDDTYVYTFGDGNENRQVEDYAEKTWHDVTFVLGGYDSTGGIPWREGELPASYLYGCAVFIDDELQWRWDQQNATALYPSLGSYNADGYIDNVCVPDYDLSDLLAPEAYNGSPVAGSTFTHSADCLIEFPVSTLPAIGQIELRFRTRNAANYWQVTVDNAGNLDLDEVVAGVPVQRGTSAAAVGAGNKVYIRADDERIEVVVEFGVSDIDYGAAANFKTATRGELETLGTGGAVGFIASYPLTSTAYTQELEFVRPRTDGVSSPLLSTTVVDDTKYNAFPGLVELPNGNLIVVYRKADTHAVDNDGDIVRRTSTNGGVTWSAESFVYESEAGMDARGPSITRLSNGTLIVSFFKSPVAAGDPRVFSTRSTDGGASWDVPVAISSGIEDEACAAPIVELSNGTLVLPFYSMDTLDTFWSANVMSSNNGGDSWGNLVTIADGETDNKHYTEPNLLLLPGGTLLSFIRVTSEFTMYRSVSGDGGATWGALAAVLTDVWASPHCALLDDGRIVVVQRSHGTTYPYFNLSMLLFTSSDNGVTWGWPFTAHYDPSETLEMEYGSPVQLLNGELGLAYGFEETADTNCNVYYRQYAASSLP